MFTLVPLGAAAPFGTTVVGWGAGSKIRGSAGRLHGMWLAVFDGLVSRRVVELGVERCPFSPVADP